MQTDYIDGWPRHHYKIGGTRPGRPRDGPTAQELTELDRLTTATQDSWESALELPARAAAIGLPLVALALLLMPASNQFFRRQRDATLPAGPQAVM